ncbi:MAG: xanthine dehydrogenase family protein subunit M [Dehalococcoidia bacterium]|nr:xanthine dehydrogenase family protein subunit M [Dehalococcoidia bacterium]
MYRFEYYRPTSVAEAVALLREKGEGGKILAGGTDLIPQMKERGRHPKYIVSLSLVKELRGISFDNGDGLKIGAGTLMAQVAEHPLINERFNVLAQGAELIGSLQTMNLATVGGNVCNAAPSADAVPAFIVMDSEVGIVGPGGSRTMPMWQVFEGPGRTALKPDEILTEVRVPTPTQNSAGVYIRHCPRKELDIAIAGVGVYLGLDSNNTISHARVCLASVAPVPLRATKTEEYLVGKQPSEAVYEQAGQIASGEARPITDMRGSAEFRHVLVKVLAIRCLRQAVDAIGVRTTR